MRSQQRKTAYSIPAVDLKTEISLMRQELDEAYDRVMQHGQFIMGPEVQQLEEEIAHYIGTRYAIAVNSGTDALTISLRSMGIGEGDEVITTPFTFFATVESILMAGARPVFVDIQAHDCNLNPDLIDAAITEKTKAILPVHLYGKMAYMESILSIAEVYHLKVLEDCAQAFGSEFIVGSNENKNGQKQKIQTKKAGAMGDAAGLSFFPSKNLGGFGDGGMVLTNHPDVADLAQMLRVHGAKKKYHNVLPGYNSRLDTLQAVMLLVKLTYVDHFLEKRRELALRYNSRLQDIDGLELFPFYADRSHTYNQYVIRISDGRRDAVAESLKKQGIHTNVYYPVPCHRTPVFENCSFTLPVSDQMAEEVLSLPLYPTLALNEVEIIADCIVDIM